MTLNEYQEQALRTSRAQLTGTDHLINGCLGLAGEAGECADLLKKHLYQDDRPIKEALISIGIACAPNAGVKSLTGKVEALTEDQKASLAEKLSATE